MKRETAKLILDNFTDEQLDDLGLITDREILQHYVDGGEVEFLENYREGRYAITRDPEFSKASQYRKAEPPEIEYMGVKVRIKPPMIAVPMVGTVYWVVTAAEDCGYDFMAWDNEGLDHLLLKRGRCLWSEEDAKKVVKALGWDHDE